MVSAAALSPTCHHYVLFGRKDVQDVDIEMSDTDGIDHNGPHRHSDEPRLRDAGGDGRPARATAENGTDSTEMSIDRLDDAVESQQIRIMIRVPAADAECPISLERINTSEVPGFEGFRMDSNLPEFREIVLPCEHTFAANYLLVSWLTSSMRCPLCRKGNDSKLDPVCFPIAWHEEAHAYVDRLKAERISEQLTIDYDEALRSSLTRTANIQLYICAYIIHTDGTVESTVVQFSSNNNEIPEDPSEDLVLSVSRASVRGVSGLIRRTECMGLNLVVFARCVGQEVELIEVANSGLMAMPLRNEGESMAGNVHPTRLLHIVQRSIQQDSPVYIGGASFTMEWQQYPNPVMDTLTQISFAIPFCDLALTIGGLFLA